MKLSAGTLAFAVLFVLLPLSASAQASMFVSPANGTYEVGELFSILVNINTGGESINAGTAAVNFDNLRLEVVDVGFNRSIFNIWTEEPVFSNAGGTIKFSGGVPNPGFAGASGAVVRVTFKPKATGRASVVFTSGSVLANDGQGTNILDSMSGSSFVIIPASKEVKKIVEAPTTEATTTARLITPPIITDWPNELRSGDTLTISGLAFPLSRVLIFVQKVNARPERFEIFSGDDGRFTHTYEQVVQRGYYKAWAKNVTPDGVESPPSETIEVEVLASDFLRIGSVVINYASIVVTLVGIIILLIAAIAYLVSAFRKMRRRQYAEIKQAEEAVHDSFDQLREGVDDYADFLTDAKSIEVAAKRRAETQKKLRQEIANIERNIKKEIGDI